MYTFISDARTWVLTGNRSQNLNNDSILIPNPIPSAQWWLSCHSDRCLNQFLSLYHRSTSYDITLYQTLLLFCQWKNNVIYQWNKKWYFSCVCTTGHVPDVLQYGCQYEDAEMGLEQLQSQSLHHNDVFKCNVHKIISAHILSTR